MNLEEKKALGPCVRIPFDLLRIQELFDQESVRREIQEYWKQFNELTGFTRHLMEVGLPDFGFAAWAIQGRVLMDSIAEKRMESYDSFSGCAADYYGSVLETMGFEKVGHSEHPLAGTGKTYSTTIHARANGFLLVLGAVREKPDEPEMCDKAMLYFQWLPPDGSASLERVSSSWHRTEDNSWVCCASMDVRDGVREKMKTLLETKGKFCSPFLVTEDKDPPYTLATGLDWISVRHSLKTEKSGKVNPYAEADRVAVLEEERYKALPEWVREMLPPIRREITSSPPKPDIGPAP